MKQQNAKLILCGICPETREVLSWTKLDRIFEIIDTEADLPATAGLVEASK